MSLRTGHFTARDQDWFARVSGDQNPVHVDGTYARRTLAGGAIVHGMHLVLWALDAHLAHAPEGTRVGAVEASFPRTTGLDVAVDVTREAIAADSTRLEIRAAGTATTVLIVHDRPHETASEYEGDLPLERWSASPRQLTFDQLTGRECRLPLETSLDAIAVRYPHTVRALGHSAAGLAALSRVVGMECPGLHSLFASVAVSFVENQRVGLEYRVTRADRPVAPVRLEVRAPGIQGSARVFFRPPPREQSSIEQVREFVKPGEFAGQHALVVGGSRGLGETTAKVLGAGGAKVAITYHSGELDARRVAEEIRAVEGSCDYFRLDVLEPEPELTAIANTTSPNRLYYYATPQIARSQPGGFDPRQFHRFETYYVGAFLTILNRLRGKGHFRVFYPSTVHLDSGHDEFAEYVLAKAAGEAVCRKWEEIDPELSFIIRRLPRLATDQTASILGGPAGDPLPILTSVVREMEKT